MTDPRIIVIGALLPFGVVGYGLCEAFGEALGGFLSAMFGMLAYFFCFAITCRDTRKKGMLMALSGFAYLCFIAGAICGVFIM